MAKPLLEARDEKLPIGHSDDTSTTEETSVEVILVAPLVAPRVNIRSPRLAHREDAAIFIKQIIPE